MKIRAFALGALGLLLAGEFTTKEASAEPPKAASSAAELTSDINTYRLLVGEKQTAAALLRRSNVLLEVVARSGLTLDEKAQLLAGLQSGLTPGASALLDKALTGLTTEMLGALAYFVVSEPALYDGMGVKAGTTQAPIAPDALASFAKKYLVRRADAIKSAAAARKKKLDAWRKDPRLNVDPEQLKDQSTSDIGPTAQGAIDAQKGSAGQVSKMVDCMKAGMHPRAINVPGGSAGNPVGTSVEPGGGGHQPGKFGNHGQPTPNQGCTNCSGGPMGTCFGALDPYKLFTSTGAGVKTAPQQRFDNLKAACGSNTSNLNKESYKWSVTNTWKENGTHTITREFVPTEITKEAIVATNPQTKLGEQVGERVTSITGTLKQTMTVTTPDGKTTTTVSEGGPVTVTPAKNAYDYENEREHSDDGTGPKLDSGLPPALKSGGSQYNPESDANGCSGNAGASVAACLFSKDGGTQSCGAAWSCKQGGGPGCPTNPVAGAGAGPGLKGSNTCKPDSWAIDLVKKSPGIHVTDPSPEMKPPITSIIQAAKQQQKNGQAATPK